MILAAGCGDTAEKNDYVDQVNRVQDELVSQITAATNKTLDSQKAAAEYAASIAAIFSDAAEKFQAIDPPADVSDLHAQLVDQMRSIASQTQKTAKTLRNGSPQEAQKALADLQTEANEAQSKFTSLIDQINSDLQD